MIYAFDEFELDISRAELRMSGVQVPVEPRVFDLLLMLVQKPDIVISRDELVETIWDNRVISEAAIASCIKAARKALGDAGNQQRFIKTIRGRGIRFMADVKQSSPGPVIKETIVESPDTPPVPQLPQERPSIADLPFNTIGNSESHPGIAEAIPHDLITELSRLRWLFVIARGSTFRYRSGEADIREVGQKLSVAYVLTGFVEINAPQIALSVELSETKNGGVIWADRRQCSIDLIQEVRGEMASNIVSLLEFQITTNEANRAKLISSENLDAWSAYHLGLKHMYRFTKSDNARATSYFQQAVALDPHFTRANAGLSFTHFQNAFLNYNKQPEAETELARQFAEKALEQDALDPFANFVMGRSFWMKGDLESSQDWLARATDLNPNYAQGLYTRAVTGVLMGNSDSSRKLVDEAISLSPLDPLNYAMCSTRSLTHILREEYDEAVKWAKKGAGSPGAHVHIAIISLIAHDLNQDLKNAEDLAAKIKFQNKAVDTADFMRSFPFQDGKMRTLIQNILTRYGF